MSGPDVDVVVVGSGPSGLAAAVELRRLGIPGVRVLEREGEAGGTPRHCAHLGFGWLHLSALHDGPDFARALVAQAQDAGVEIHTDTSVLEWEGRDTLRVTSPNGVSSIRASAVVLATGCRERPRAARLVPGTRPAGVLTTGALQRLVHQHGQPAGRRAVVVGAELVSYSAVLTLNGSGTEVVAMVTEHPDQQVVPVAGQLFPWANGIPLHTRTRVARIQGQRRVESVVLRNVDSGQEQTVACDTVVFTGAWIPEHALARSGGIVLDAATRGPLVDMGFHTNVPGVFAVGNLLHGAEMADHVAGEGRSLAPWVRHYLQTGHWPNRGVRVSVAPPLAWICPSVIDPDGRNGIDEEMHRFTLRTTCFMTQAHLTVHQGHQVLHEQRYLSLVPNRSIGLGAAWLDKVRPDEGEVGVRLQ